ncbi:MAG: c-type cytochrome biogenesis protein CcmI [Proteobacteria bacterium]|nr:c-type cytochrome biogenesis protein CcmI [Pseudomonadota bacterium]
MLTFWIAAALMSAAAGALVLWRASRRDAPEAENPELAVYRRHLAELEEQRAEGLLDDEAYRAARAEAGRRLLKAGETPSEASASRDPTRDGAMVFGAVALAALITAGVYLTVGSPGQPDQPFAKRLKAWNASDPTTLPPAELAMWLKDKARTHPNDPRVWSVLGEAYAAAGDPSDAAQAFQTALRLDATRAQDWANLGRVETDLDDGRVGPNAKAAFETALKLDPKSQTGLLGLSEAAAAEGRRAEAADYLRRLADTLPTGDPRHALFAQRAAEMASGKSAPASGQDAMIQAMVAKQAAELKTNPNDPAGWARLVRAYGVLGDKPAQAQALATARQVFKDQPKIVAAIEAEAK